MPRSCPPAIRATRRPGKASIAARVGSTLVDRLSSTKTTPPTVADDLEPARQRGETRGGGGSAVSSAACGTPSARRQARAIRALRRLCAPSRPSGAIQSGAGVVTGADPLHARPEQGRTVAQRVAVPVGDGQLRPGLGADRQLVAVVGLHVAVPVEVVGVQRGDRDHRRRAGQVGRLVAGRLDDPVVVVAVVVPPGPRAAGRCCRPQAAVAPPASAGARRWPWWCSCPWCR